jgi:exportin-1
MQQSGEQEPFIDEILRNLHRITVDLSPQQVSVACPSLALSHADSSAPRSTLSTRLSAT